DAVYIGIRLLKRDAAFDSSDDVQVVTAAPAQLPRRIRGRHPQINIALHKLKTRGHDSGDRVFFCIEENLAADDAALSAVSALPEAITEHRDFVCFGFVVIG